MSATMVDFGDQAIPLDLINAIMAGTPITELKNASQDSISVEACGDIEGGTSNSNLAGCTTTGPLTPSVATVSVKGKRKKRRKITCTNTPSPNMPASDTAAGDMVVAPVSAIKDVTVVEKLSSANEVNVLLSKVSGKIYCYYLYCM